MKFININKLTDEEKAFLLESVMDLCSSYELEANGNYSDSADASDGRGYFGEQTQQAVADTLRVTEEIIARITIGKLELVSNSFSK